MDWVPPFVGKQHVHVAVDKKLRGLQRRSTVAYIPGQASTKLLKYA